MTISLQPSKIRTVTSIQADEKYQSYKKWMIRITCILLALIIALFTVPALAGTVLYQNETLPELGSDEGYNLGALKNDFNAFVFSLAWEVYGALPYLVSNNSLLRIDTSDSPESYWSAFSTFFDAFASVGIGLAVIWVMLDVLEKLQIEQLSPEILLRIFIKLFMAIMIIANIQPIAEGIINVANEMMPEASETTHIAQAEALGTIYDSLKSMGWIKALCLLLQLLIPAIGTMICMLIMLVQMVGRLIEIGIRILFMPIGVSDAFTHGTNSPGFRYIKKFFAVCLQGAVLLAVLNIGVYFMGNKMINDATQGFGFISDLVIMVSMIGLMIKSQQIVNDIVGV